jgi:uncharacterized membrane protein YvbJ
MRRFYCENCGREVDERDELCAGCGAIFVAIKCPRCGYRGKQHQFSNGCPQCGYLSEQPLTPSDLIIVDDPRGRNSAVRKKRPMPAWLFWFVLVLLVGSFAILARLYAQL